MATELYGYKRKNTKHHFEEGPSNPGRFWTTLSKSLLWQFTHDIAITPGPIK
jgi:hypothetical protein